MKIRLQISLTRCLGYSNKITIPQEYVESDPSGRDPDNVTMYQIRQGFEPPNFRAHFTGWDFRFKKAITPGV